MFRHLVLTVALLVSSSLASAAIKVTDLAGRTIQLEQPAKRIIMSEGAYVVALGLVRKDNPVAGVVGLMRPIGWAYPEFEQQLQQSYPSQFPIPLFGGQGEQTVSVEKIIQLDPELAIFGVQDHGPNSKNHELLKQLEKAGITVAFIDFRLDPLNNTLPSLVLLSQLLGTEQKAQDYLKFYQQKREAIAQRVKPIKTKPSVFVQAHIGRFDCCVAMADGMLGPFVDFVGGLNIADAVAPGPTSTHTMEFLLAKNPAVWIGTASGNRSNLGSNMVIMGLGVPANMAADSLANFLNEPGFKAMDAVRQGRAHALWHNFYNSPLNIAALEAFAQWVHPKAFADLDANKTIEQIFSHYLPLQWTGTAFIDYAE